MKVTKKQIGGGWKVLIDGKQVGGVSKQGTAGGLFLPWRPWLCTDKVGSDGDPVLQMLQPQSSVDGAVEVVRLAATSAAARVNDRVTFIGVGMTADRAAKFANAMAKKIGEEARP